MSILDDDSIFNEDYYSPFDTLDDIAMENVSIFC